MLRRRTIQGCLGLYAEAAARFVTGIFRLSDAVQRPPFQWQPSDALKLTSGKAGRLLFGSIPIGTTMPWINPRNVRSPRRLSSWTAMCTVALLLASTGWLLYAGLPS